MQKTVTLLIRDRRGSDARIALESTPDGGAAAPRLTVELSRPEPLSVATEAVEEALAERFPGWNLRFLRHVREAPAMDFVEVEPLPVTALPATLQWGGVRDLDVELARLCADWLNTPAARPWLERGYVQGEALPWIRRQLGARPAALTTMHATARSLVLRVDMADGRRVWFKADGAPEPSEAQLMEALTPIADSLLPPTLAAEPERGWLLREDFRAVSLLEDCEDTRPWAAAAESLGWLQRRAEDQLVRFRGLRDYRGEALREALLAMLASEPAAVSPADRRALEAHVERWCDALAGSLVQPSLVHQDFVGCNVALTSSRYLIFDWSDVVLGHPFFACDRLLDARWKDKAWKSAVIDSYLTAWADVASSGELRAEFAACQKLRVLYEDLRWADEIASMGPCPMRDRLHADLVAGLRGMAVWLRR